MMTLWRTTNATSNPYRYWSPDLHTKNPGYGVKAGIAGGFEQPARYLGEYAWRHYGGDKKTRALGL